jgi:primosomal protein N' (replication factor Y)
VFEAALRAEAPKLDQAIEFLKGVAAAVRAPDEVTVFDPVPHLLTRRADFERAQIVMQSGSRQALQEFLGLLSKNLFETSARHVRWHVDVDPIEFD